MCMSSMEMTKRMSTCEREGLCAFVSFSWLRGLTVAFDMQHFICVW